MTRTGRLVAIALLTVGVVACSAVTPEPVEADPPAVVARALERVAAHDLVGASTTVCAAQRDSRTLPFTLEGIFAPVQAMPTGDHLRTLQVIDLDMTGLSLVAHPPTGDAAEVEVRGVLVERFDRDRVEAQFRILAAELGEPVDERALADTLRAIAGGVVRLPVDQSVRVVREDGAWRICPIPPTP